MNAQPALSIEFFPPKTEDGVGKLRAVRQALYTLKPEFCSVTFGAGGSTQSGTFSTVQEILGEGVPAASHLSSNFIRTLPFFLPTLFVTLNILVTIS